MVVLWVASLPVLFGKSKSSSQRIDERAYTKRLIQRHFTRLNSDTRSTRDIHLDSFAVACLNMELDAVERNALVAVVHLNKTNQLQVLELGV